jgi:signal transduction histidine kinase
MSMGIFSNARYQEVVIHDLRTPLNVISLALRMIDEVASQKDPDLLEDLGLIRANTAELERMLTYLVDFSRLPETPDGLAPERFDPRRMLDEVVEEYRTRLNASEVEMDVDGAPGVVLLDQARARMAAQKALTNTAAAASGKPIRVTLTGGPDRCVFTFESAVPPRDSVQSHEIDPEDFERLLGTPAERRGLDLAIVAKVSTMFGGSSRLEARPGQGTAVILDWPAAMERAS